MLVCKLLNINKFKTQDTRNKKIAYLTKLFYIKV